MKILVFGKGGQLGKAFQEELGKRTAAQLTKPIIQHVGRSECDLINEKALVQLLNQFQPQLIINASAYTAVDIAEAESESAFAINARAPELMAQYSADHGITFLHYSTDYVFDGEKEGFYLEDDLRNPLGVYGKSKAAGEESISRVFSQVKGAGLYAIFRTSWLYGDGGNFIRTILSLAKDREELKVIEDQYGVPTSAQWLAEISLDLAIDPQGTLRPFPSGIYHAVPAGEISWYGLSYLAVKTALSSGVSLKITPERIKPIPAVKYPLPAPRPMNSRMLTDKLAQVFRAEGNMSKLQLLNQPWDIAVKVYISNLARDGLI